jgi:hypothetical protein
MEKAVSRLNDSVNASKETPSSSDLGGDFPISDLDTGEVGVLQVSMEGIGLCFEGKNNFVELKRVRKCTTQNDDIFVLEEFGKQYILDSSFAKHIKKMFSIFLKFFHIDPKVKQIVVRKFKSPMVSNLRFICKCDQKSIYKKHQNQIKVVSDDYPLLLAFLKKCNIKSFII